MKPHSTDTMQSAVLAWSAQQFDVHDCASERWHCSCLSSSICVGSCEICVGDCSIGWRQVKDGYAHHLSDHRLCSIWVRYELSKIEIYLRFFALEKTRLMFLGGITDLISISTFTPPGTRTVCRRDHLV